MQKPISKLAKLPLIVRLSASTLAIAVLMMGSISGIRNVFAVEATCNTIAECNSQIANSRSAVEQLKSQAASYQDAINLLKNQIYLLQVALNQNTARQQQLEQEIAKMQAEITHQREVLASALKAMYVDDQMSTIEMLATSKNLSDFVDKEVYRTAVQTQIQETLKEIAALQEKLKNQKSEVETLIGQQKEQQSQLASAKAAQDQMLAYNQSQQNAFNAQATANQSRLEALIAEQRRANQGPVSSSNYYLIRFPGPVRDFDGTSYKWRNAGFSMSTLPGCGHPDPRTGERDQYDGWGYCTRQCVSYAAWAVGASGRSIPTNLGSANRWPYNVPSSYLHTSNPQVGDVLITMGGNWGHAMYVEAVSGNSVRVSEYNQQLDGEYQSHRWISLR